ncbi:alpha/beta hydrolase [Azospirillum rugosum]|uniref:Arylformamidase n=1 Tax=Azospirillum rugosum TaxID=416170 RepID=A0ABS4SK17_9PROT|nr:alpha/beta hydrolase [Azospirillum rugosum]MBP2292905.1 arylformamidase [Azospirillum rugosum]MDQ0529343.1 arylformamidase [Azospirillum rugosum]
MAFDFPAGHTWADGDPAPIDEAMEREFNLRPRHPEREAVYADFARRSAAFREAHPALLDQRYGPGPRARLDVFPAGDGAPVFLFIHGGYWRTLDKDVFSFLAASFVDAGISVVMPNYDLVPSVPLADIVEQMRQALAWVRAEAASFGADASRIVLSGHSAGGHLAAYTALTDSIGIRGVLPVSGVFELARLLRTSINRDARMTPAVADALSPHRLAAEMTSLPAVPLLLLVGGEETAGFQQQSRDFLEVWRGRGRPGAMVLAPGRTHFTVLETLADPHGPVFNEVRRILGTQPQPSEHKGH